MVVDPAGNVSFSQRNPLLGAWKLKSYVREVAATSKRYNERGEDLNGYLNYSADGSLYAIITWDNRPSPNDVVPTNEERVRLYRTMISYAGIYTVDAQKVIHHVDISWNQNWTGTESGPLLPARRRHADHRVAAPPQNHAEPAATGGASWCGRKWRVPPLPASSLRGVQRVRPPMTSAATKQSSFLRKRP